MIEFLLSGTEEEEVEKHTEMKAEAPTCGYETQRYKTIKLR